MGMVLFFTWVAVVTLGYLIGSTFIADFIPSTEGTHSNSSWKTAQVVVWVSIQIVSIALVYFVFKVAMAIKPAPNMPISTLMFAPALVGVTLGCGGKLSAWLLERFWN